MAIGTTVKLGWDAASVNRGMSTLQGRFRRLSSGIGHAVANVAKMGAALAAAAAAFAGWKAIEFLKDSSSAAASIEVLTVQFKVLLGSVEKAKKRMEEITKFAAETPFEIEGLAQASKLLQMAGGDLLATGEGLRLVGDAAALANQPVEEVAVHMARLFQALTSGTAAGESANRLSELAIISGKSKVAYQEFTKAMQAGKTPILNAEQALALMKRTMQSADGMMIEMSKTIEGKTSNMADNFSQLKVALGEGLNVGLRSALDRVNDFLPQWKDKFTMAGKIIGDAIADAVEGDTTRFKLIGELIGSYIQDGINFGMKEAGAWLWEYMVDQATLRKVGPVSTPFNDMQRGPVDSWMRSGGNDIRNLPTGSGSDRQDEIIKELREIRKNTEDRNDDTTNWER